MEGMGCCCVLPVLFPIFVFFWVGIGQRLGVRRYGLYVAASVPAFIAFLFLAYATICVTKLVLDVCTSDAYVYEHSFGFSPTPDVQIIRSSWRDDGDSRTKYLKFQADQSTIDRIIAERALLPQESATPSSRREDPSWWDWWRDPKRRLVYSYNPFSRAGRGGELSFEDEVLIYDATTREAYYRYYGNNY